MEQRYNAVYPENFDFKEIFHTSAFEKPLLPLLTCEQSDKFSLMNWGLIPAWVKTEQEAHDISIKTMNARVETLTQKPSFRQSVESKRCIIPITGFFEWQQIGSKKIPWYISLEGEDVFSLAGLWSEWSNPMTSEVSQTFTIITTEANDLMAQIHNTKKRMPAILSIENEKIWLEHDLKNSTFDTIIKPYNCKNLKAYTVSSLVSQTIKDRNIPEVLDLFDYNSPSQGKLF